MIELVGSRPRIPILVLNRVKTDLISRLSPAYSLSLAIEDDAESTINQIAREADRPRVVVFHADSPLGLRASEAINKQLILVGGSSGGKFALDKKKPEIAITEAFKSLIAKTDGAKCQNCSVYVLNTHPEFGKT